MEFSCPKPYQMPQAFQFPIPTSKCRTINCFTAEAIALRDAVSLARNMDMDRVIFESDCLDLVKAVGLLGRLVKAMKWLILLLKWLALALFLPPGPGIAQFILRGLLIKIALQQEDKGSASVVCWGTGCDVVFKIHCFTLGLAWVGVVFSAVLYPGRSGAFVAGLVVVLRIFDPMDLDISSFEIILRPPCGFSFGFFVLCLFILLLLVCNYFFTCWIFSSAVFGFSFVFVVMTALWRQAVKGGGCFFSTLRGNLFGLEVFVCLLMVEPGFS